jgi:hypothetical protein
MSAVNQLVKRIEDSLIVTKTYREESTKSYFILPFFAALGFDTHNPNDIQYDVNEEINNARNHFALLFDSRPEVLVESKAFNTPFNRTEDILSNAHLPITFTKYIILSNGVEYLFFSEGSHQGVISKEPFYSLTLTNLSEQDITFLSAITKSDFRLSDYTIEPKVTAFIQQNIIQPDEFILDYIRDSLRIKISNDDLVKLYLETLQRPETIITTVETVDTEVVNVVADLPVTPKVHSDVTEALEVPITSEVHSDVTGIEEIPTSTSYPQQVFNGLILDTETLLRRPENFTFQGYAFEFESWADVVATLVKEILDEKDDSTKTKLLTLWSHSTFKFFITRGEALNHSNKSGGGKVKEISPDFFLCISLNTLDTMKKCLTMLNSMGYDKDTLQFYYEKG